MKCLLSVAFLGGLISVANAHQAAIIDPPQNLTINAGADAQFSVVATNTESYQWVFQGTNIPGATQSSLLIENVGTNQAGDYWVIVGGSVSNSASLTVLQGTIVQLQISGFTTGASSSNIVIELFDHDRPATVQNFLHYFRTNTFGDSFAYSNMFVDRLIPGFVLQLGDYDAQDRTNTTPPLQPFSIVQNYVQGPATVGTVISDPPLPAQLNNEAYSGPFVSNTKGTLAMALPSGNTNGAENAFFFNLVDNTNLDSTNDGGPFTVFARVISGSSVLDYFNNTNSFSKPPPQDFEDQFGDYILTSNIFTNGIFDVILLQAGATAFTDLPENFHGTNIPANTSVFFVDFSFPNPNALPHIDTNPPTVSLSLPAENQFLTNGASLTVQGTAADDVGLALVAVTLTGLDNQNSETNDATGTANWTTTFTGLQPGNYLLSATAQDGAGNQTTTDGPMVTVTAVLTNGSGTVSATNFQGGAVFTNAVGAPLQIGGFYTLNAQPGPGQLFLNWSGGGSVSVNSNLTIQVGEDEVWTATFISNTSPTAIITPPQNLTINAGEDAQFSAQATNVQTYQWVFQGTNIPGATQSNLVIEGVSTNQAGDYWVIAGGPGNLASNSAHLTVVQGTIVQLQISGFTTGAPSSNIVVELFDHDKPATVQNFLHYFRTNTFGDNFAYSNVFLYRLIPGFVLQMGDYDATDRTNSTPPPEAISVDEVYVQEFQVNNPPLPFQVDNEAFSGPFVSNTKGTLAMALPPGNTNGAENSFFFNLVDNPILDTPGGGGPFTVFGRVISGTNVLDYFNNTNYFSKPPPSTNYSDTTGFYHPTTNIFTGGIYDSISLNSNSTTFNDMPENFHGTNIPANTNLFFVDFSFPDPNALPQIDTSPPSTPVITAPGGSLFLNNGASVTVQGTASDDVGLARVVVSLDGLDNNNSANGNAIGTTNWSMTFTGLEPGSYTFSATSQDGAGNVSTAWAGPSLLVTAVLTNGIGTIRATNLSDGTIYTNAVGAPLGIGSTYAFGAFAGPNQVFVNWAGGGGVSLSPNVTVDISQNLVLTATFVSNDIPGGISFTYPPLRGQITNGTFSFQGTINGLGQTMITCQLFTYATRLSLGASVQTTGTTNWSVPQTNNLAPGRYFVQALAQDNQGRTTVITNDFTVLAKMIVITNGPGTLSTNYNGKYLVPGQQYTMKATPLKNEAFYSWSDGVNTSLNPTETFTVTSNQSLTATFISNSIPNSITFTNPAANAGLTNTSVSLAGKIAPAPAIVATQILCQIFYKSNAIAAPFAANIASNNIWSAAPHTLSPGHYTVQAVASDNLGRHRMISENFDVKALVRVSTNGPGTISPNIDGQFFLVGTEKTLKATPKTGYMFTYWSGSVSTNVSPTLEFTVNANMNVVANFQSNYYLNVAGTYDGLFFPTNQALYLTNSGYYTITVTTAGKFTGTMSISGANLPIQGVFDYNGGVGLFGNGPAGQGLTNVVFLDLTNGTYSLSGVVFNQYFAANLIGYRALTKLATNSVVYPGSYIISIPGSHSTTNNLPDGDSYGTVTFGPTGTVVASGLTADNTAFTHSTGVSKDGIWPFFTYLYSSKAGYLGYLMGWETNSSPTNFSGSLDWFKPLKFGTYYTNGIGASVNSSVARFVPPLPETAYQITFNGGTLTNALTYPLSVSTAGQFTTAATNHLTISLTKTGTTAGTLTGTFLNPVTAKKVTFHGAFTSPAAGGSGYTLDAGSETGYFEIVAQ